MMIDSTPEEEANIPSKVELFGWRVVHNGLAVRENLHKRGIIEGKRMCGEEIETILHTLGLWN